MEWEQQAVIEDLGSALAYRAFTMKSSNSFIENDVVINNLTEVALFFVALALTLESRLDTAIHILKELLSSVENNVKIGKTSPHLNNFLRSIKRCYAVALDSRFLNFYTSQLIGNVTDNSYDEKFRQGENLLRELLDIDPKRSMYPLRQAIFDLHFGNIDQAFKNVALAKRLAPANDPAPHFSFAFLCLWKGQFKRAISEYQKVIETDKHFLNVFGSVLDFILSFHRRYPDRPEFLFALGFMNQNFFDIEQSVEDYTEFIQQAKEDPKFLPLVDYAKRQLVLICD